jgi:hypothetical protein
MTPAAFVRALEAELRLRGVPFDLRDLLAFAESVWRIAEDDPNPLLWADAFVKEVRAAARSQKATNSSEAVSAHRLPPGDEV